MSIEDRDMALPFPAERIVKRLADGSANRGRSSWYQMGEVRQILRLLVYDEEGRRWMAAVLEEASELVLAGWECMATGQMNESPECESHLECQMAPLYRMEFK